MEKEKSFKAKVRARIWNGFAFSKKSITETIIVFFITFFAKTFIFGEGVALLYLQELLFSLGIVGVSFLICKLIAYWIWSLYAVGKEQDEKLEILNWNKIDIAPCKYRVFNINGWGLSVINNKNFDLGQINLEIVGIKVDGTDIFSLTDKKHELGRIENSQNPFNETIFHSTNGVFARINSGKTKIFPITSITNDLSTNNIAYTFLTFPESDRDLEWPFLRNSSNENLPIVVLKIKIECLIFENEIMVNHLYGNYAVEVKNDGSLIAYKEKLIKEHN